MELAKIPAGYRHPDMKCDQCRKPIAHDDAVWIIVPEGTLAGRQWVHPACVEKRLRWMVRLELIS